MTQGKRAPDVAFTVNGSACSAAPRAGLSLLGHLRGPLGLIGTKTGCGTGDCGACTVVMDGVAVQSCQVPMAALEGVEVQTIETLVQHAPGKAIAGALIAAGAAQCGYCLPGIVASACAALAREGTEVDFDAALSRNLCRCGTHHRIRWALATLTEPKQ